MRIGVALTVALWGCNVDAPVASAKLPQALPDDAFETLNDPAAAHAELCDHDATDTTFPDEADRLTNRFCQDQVPQPHSLADLLKVLDLDFKSPTGNGINGNPAFAILGHSSALTAREVSAIAPTAFVFTPLGPDGKPPRDYTFLAYDPGESFVEVASYAPADQAVNFYLVQFDKACGANCSPEDMLTPAQTEGWSNIRIYESTTALNNTIADCRQCHIGSGTDTGDPLILRMQEIDAPHTHWFSTQTEGGQSLLADFHAAHGTTEMYGGIPADLIDASDPELMAQFIRAAGFGSQPNPFPAAVEMQVEQNCPTQPAANVPMGWSTAWNAAYEAGATGQAIAAPYHDVKVTDPTLLATATDAYVAWRGGAALQMDIRDVLLGTGLADMGISPKAGSTGKQILVQQCQQCHNARLDPTLSRDKFLVDRIDQMSRAEKDLAIERIQTSIDTRLTMPPPLFRLPSDADRAAMIEELRQ
ncbi:MAG: hypothetical protein QM831_09625 [Kofleriaceae bacterium]